MFWGDKTIAAVEREFFATAHGFVAECLALAKAGDVAAGTRASEPLGLVLASFSHYWAGQRNTEARTKALLKAVDDFPGQLTQVVRDIAKRKPSPDSHQQVVQATQNEPEIQRAFLRNATKYLTAFQQDDHWIQAHAARGAKPTIPFRHATRELVANYLAAHYHPEKHNTWVMFGPVVGLLAAKAMSFRS